MGALFDFNYTYDSPMMYDRHAVEENVLFVYYLEPTTSVMYDSGMRGTGGKINVFWRP